MAEKLCTLRGAGGGGAKQTETVLWTNSSPTSNFADQNVTLSDSMSNYDYLKFTYKKATNNATSTSAVFSVSDVKNFADESVYGQIGGESATDWYMSRMLWYVSDTSVKISTAWGLNRANSANNSYIIPLSIIGIKNMGGIRTNEKYDMLPFKSITGGTTPTFATKGLAKGCWLYFTSTSGTGVLTNVNPYTGELETSKCWRCMGNTTTIEQYTNNYFVISNGTVALDQRYSGTTYNMALAYTY